MFGPNPIRERIQIVDAYCTTRHHTTRLSRRDIEAHALAEDERNETWFPEEIRAVTFAVASSLLQSIPDSHIRLQRA